MHTPTRSRYAISESADTRAAGEAGQALEGLAKRLAGGPTTNLGIYPLIGQPQRGVEGDFGDGMRGNRWKEGGKTRQKGDLRAREAVRGSHVGVLARACLACARSQRARREHLRVNLGRGQCPASSLAGSCARRGAARAVVERQNKGDHAGRQGAAWAGGDGMRDVGREGMCVEDDGWKEGGRGGRTSGAGCHKTVKTGQGRPLRRRGSEGSGNGRGQSARTC